MVAAALNTLGVVSYPLRNLTTVIVLGVTAASFVPACMLFRSLADLSSESAAASDASAARDGITASDVRTRDDPRDVDTAPFCATRSPKPAFCDDFDDEAKLDARWEISPAQSGSVSRDHYTKRSRPVSLVTRAGPSTDDCNYGAVTKRVPGSFRRARLSFAIWLDPTNPPVAIRSRRSISARSRPTIRVNSWCTSAAMASAFSNSESSRAR